MGWGNDMKGKGINENSVFFRLKDHKKGNQPQITISCSQVTGQMTIECFSNKLDPSLFRQAEEACCLGLKSENCTNLMKANSRIPRGQA